jgi:hypothetical protein
MRQDLAIIRCRRLGSASDSFNREEGEMTRSRMAGVVVAAAVAGAALTTSGSSARASGPASMAGVPRSCPRVGRYEQYDPRDALPLPGDGVAEASDATLSYFEHSTSHGQSTRNGLAKGAFIVSAEVPHPLYHADSPGDPVQRLCGRTIAGRTVIVVIFFPKALPSSSLSYSVVWVSRFPGSKYGVWYRFH